jgi:hypothetical protein
MGLIFKLDEELKNPDWQPIAPSARDPLFYQTLVRFYDLATLEYDTLRNSIQTQAKLPPADINPPELFRKIFIAKEHAKILQHLYKRYINGGQNRFAEDIRHYDDFLTELSEDPNGLRGGFLKLKKLMENKRSEIDQFLEKLNFSARLRRLHTILNPPRLTLIRTKALMEASSNMPEVSPEYKRILKEQRANWADLTFLLAGWVFFIPRLANQVYLLTKHLGKAIEDESDERLPILDILALQLLIRGGNIGNDTSWMLSGLFNQFLWIGPLAFVKVFSNIGFASGDLIRSCFQLGINQSRYGGLLVHFGLSSNNYGGLLEEYKKKLEEEDLSDEDRAMYRDCMARVQERIWLDQKNILFNGIINLFLVIASISKLPIFAFMPLISVLGSVLAVTVTLISWGVNEGYFERQRLDNSALKLPFIKQGMFNTRRDPSSSNSGHISQSDSVEQPDVNPWNLG